MWRKAAARTAFPSTGTSGSRLRHTQQSRCPTAQAAANSDSPLTRFSQVPLHAGTLQVKPQPWAMQPFSDTARSTA
ncbi:hypothetical protein [uncultured Megasphaera sp.]|uniref:hypothetical protein n=1 Tax=uncultured Megasphaera sp. TaxID=165188 RepID=UPI002592E9F8|nr:hypothetical protein [uncultured Megasphaera sp.]